MEFDLVMRYGGSDQPKPPKPDPSVPAVEDLLRSAEEDAKQNHEDPSLALEDEEELDLKMTILDIYNERYDRRVEIKAFIFDRALTEYKKVGRPSLGVCEAKPYTEHHRGQEAEQGRARPYWSDQAVCTVADPRAAPGVPRWAALCVSLGR
jgi:hypothetical protein